MRNTKSSAFTLVELIVVITILAILGTIAFISLQGYSADARNSKRTSDLGNIQSAMSLKMVEGVPIMSFVTGTANNLLPISLAGSGAYTGDYAAGTPSYTVLNVAAKDFKDPKSDKEYRIGATKAQGAVFQLAATMEKDGVDTAQVNGTYVARDTTTVTPLTIDGTSVTVPDASANLFKVNDTINTQTSTGVVIDSNLTISKVSRDWVTLTLSATPTAGTDGIQLAVAKKELVRVLFFCVLFVVIWCSLVPVPY